MLSNNHPHKLNINPEIPWSQIIAFRNIIMHEYSGIDVELVWVIVAEHIIKLSNQIKLMMDSLSE